MTRLLVEVMKHTAKEETKASGEAPAPAKKDQSLSKLKIDQVASKDRQVSIHVNFNVPQDKQDLNIITNTARIDAALPAIKYALEMVPSLSCFDRSLADLVVRRTKVPHSTSG